ncbi:g5325 [Coccomyxa viridis]|uniref:G5325 protein n=1 Tax=Coccomyxa viridis TaxID=1274662 RepID=A0ABP1FTY6_9CHLO
MTEIKDLEALVEELEIEACRLEEEGRPIAAACNRNRAKYERSKIELLGLKSTASACEGSPNEATLPQRVQKMDAWMQKMQSLIEKATRSAEYNTKIVKQRKGIHIHRSNLLPTSNTASLARDLRITWCAASPVKPEEEDPASRT